MQKLQKYGIIKRVGADLGGIGRLFDTKLWTVSLFPSVLPTHLQTNFETCQIYRNRKLKLKTIKSGDHQNLSVSDNLRYNFSKSLTYEASFVYVYILDLYIKSTHSNNNRNRHPFTITITERLASVHRNMESNTNRLHPQILLAILIMMPPLFSLNSIPHTISIDVNTQMKIAIAIGILLGFSAGNDQNP